MIGGFAGSNSPITAIQMLWINLIMDTFASLALSTEKPAKDILKGDPEGRGTHLIKKEMFKFIAIHSFWQLFVSLFLLFAGRKLFGLTDVKYNPLVRTNCGSS